MIFTKQFVGACGDEDDDRVAINTTAFIISLLTPRPQTRLLALLHGLIVVLVSLASAIDELLALAGLNVEPPAGKVALAGTGVFHRSTVGLEVSRCSGDKVEYK